MALEPLSDAHAAQILAGIEGRLAGHRLEESLTAQVNELGKRPMLFAVSCFGFPFELFACQLKPQPGQASSSLH